MTHRLLRRTLVTCLLAAGASAQMRTPEPDPPRQWALAAGPWASRAPAEPVLAAAPFLEWAFHKTADGSHPSADEQQMVWLMNRARRSPLAEGVWLAHLRQSNVQSAMDYFGVRRDVLMNEFAVRAAMPPAAFDSRLYLAASNHAAYMISVDGQTHNGQLQRVIDQGFKYQSWWGSVYSYSDDAVYGHSGFNVDWGPGDETGMQPGRGHREGVMTNSSNVGIACVAESDPETGVGPQVITINYCKALTSYTNHYNRFIVGTVWSDSNTNDLYEAGEGRGNVTVMPDKGGYYAVTGSAGGYAIPVAAGTYALTFSGAALPSNIVKSVTVGTDSVLADVALSGTAMGVQASAALGSGGSATFVLSGQRKGCAYRLSVSTNLVSGAWGWAGVLPSGYGSTLTYNAQLFATNAPRRFLSLFGWQY